MLEQRDHIDDMLDLRDAVGKLPHRSRLILELWMEGYTQAEIGEKMGIHQSSIRRRLEKLFEVLKNA